MQNCKDDAMTERSRKQNELEKDCLQTKMDISLIRKRRKSLEIKRPVLREKITT